MKCAKCGIDPTPILLCGQMPVVACGMLKDNWVMAKEMRVDGCPVHDWQQGYIACLGSYSKYRTALQRISKGTEIIYFRENSAMSGKPVEAKDIALEALGLL